MQRVVEDPHHGDAYTEVGDVLKRHMTLDSTFRTLRTDVQAKEQQIDRTRESMRVLVQEVQNHVLVKNSEVRGMRPAARTPAPDRPVRNATPRGPDPREPEAAGAVEERVVQGGRGGAAATSQARTT